MFMQMIQQHTIHRKVIISSYLCMSHRNRHRYLVIPCGCYVAYCYHENARTNIYYADDQKQERYKLFHGICASDITTAN